MATRTPIKSLWTDRPDDWLSAPDAPEASPPPATNAAPPPGRPRRRGRAAVAVLAAAVLGGGAYVAGAADDPGAPSRAAALPAASGQLAPSQINAIYAQASKGVVNVRVSSGGSQGTGTGFVIDEQGRIVTNAHVVGDATRAQVRFDDDSRLVDAAVVGRDPSTDLAVLKVDPGQAGDLRPLTLAASKDVKVGDGAVAIGYPLGLDRTATAGIVSGLEREIEAPNGFRIDEVIQTDASINPGNSGGPLLDARGRVIGVNSQIATSGAGGGNTGIGFAVPSDTVRAVVPRLLAGETIERAWLGVATAEAAGATGATVATVTPGSPAARAGLAEGDRITEVGDTRIDTPDDVAEALEPRTPGDEVAVRVERDGRERVITVDLGARPETTP